MQAPARVDEALADVLVGLGELVADAEFASELDVEDVTISANCASCGANVMITMSALMKKAAR